MWIHRDGKNRITEDEVWIRINDLLVTNEFSPLSKTKFTEVINDLCDMKCIELDNGVIWLREWVRVTYN